MKLKKENLIWTREPKRSEITDDKIVIYTDPSTDLWQRTYYGFQNDNAPVLQLKTEEKFFSFTVKTEFESKVLFDQCGVVFGAYACSPGQSSLKAVFTEMEVTECKWKKHGE